MAFHAGNLALHVTVSLVLLGFARDFLADAAGLPDARARRIGGWAALLFAVHPLCSEMPNYARARDIGMVSLFSLLAAWAMVHWRREGEWRPFGVAVAAVAAAAFSKEVSLPLAVGMVGMLRPPVVRRVALAGIVATGVIVSARRTLDWRNLDKLVANVTAQYPANARARQEL